MALPRAQELTEYITITNTTGESSSIGIREKSANVATAWARITENGGTMEATDQQHEMQEQEFEIITQYIDGIKAWMSITWGTRQLDIVEPPQKVFDANNRPWMIIRAQETTERSL